jgi:uncharacterized delta-60 repeat protein
VKRGLLTAAVTAAVAGALPAHVHAQAGALDPTFGGDGKILTNAISGLDYAIDVAVQPADGKIVAAGLAGGGGGRILLVRYEADGTLDPTFSGDGKVFTNLTPGLDAANGIEVQADGKIVVAGQAGGAGGRFAVARYNADGSLDSSFSADGMALTNFTAANDFAFGVLVQPDGKIVAAGRAGGAGGRIALARYDADGSLDATFSGDGRLMTNFTPGDDRADHVVLQADEKIVAAGTANSFGRTASFAVVRYNADGTLDAGFSGDGKLRTNFTPGFDGSFGVAIQPLDQKIVAVGQAGLYLALARYNANGSLDPTFSGDGKTRTNFTPGLDYAEEVEVQADGMIVVAGTANWFARNSRFALARYRMNGALDSTFAGDGKVVTDFTAGFDAPFGLAIQPADGKIVAAGFAGGAGGRVAVARYLGS